ncbi:MAG: D-glycero-beta-D-manno-heptose 1-phosphate adenylyltransferase [Phaeodactylibacter sp.]|nr:D-glycero-beta-D-manno-heptose 1-phosphate adenylyltransferase [Phaeodactylibacter sp.]
MKIVFTNGCFDILHYGHIQYLASARELGHKLIVGMNSDRSITGLKGANRPINDALTRFHLMAALEFVDLVVPFEQETPLQLIQLLLPNVLVKGGDWAPTLIVGAQEVLQEGGQVLSLPFVEGYSTTNIEEKIKNS